MVILKTVVPMIPTMGFYGVKYDVVDDVDASAQIPSTSLGQEITFSYHFLKVDDTECFLSAADYPLLVDTWNNMEDAIYDLL